MDIHSHMRVSYRKSAWCGVFRAAAEAKSIGRDFGANAVPNPKP